jgi:acetylornithine deacetylase/succinyl-diaminopimelate desuccinylase-like protein
MELTKQIQNYIGGHRQEAYELLLELAQIPAPSNHEEKRAVFCRDWLQKQGAGGVFLDDALNVIYPVGCTETNELVVFMAHSDVVFPDMEDLPLKVEEGRVCCPGVGDDTANVVALLMAAKFLAEHGLTPAGCGLLIVINSGEEGLGNLKGCRKIMEVFGDRVREFITLDDQSFKGVNRAVGSGRFRIEVETEGGHSFNDFGRVNAIAVLSALIEKLYRIQVPPIGKTTYNVGLISGGTSVNTIAQHAEMLYEFRSDERDALAIMQQSFDEVIESSRAAGTNVKVTVVGDRPCGAPVDESRMNKLMQRAQEAALRRYGHEISFGSGSTDCNIPLSLGTPAICVGCCRFRGAHTREEYVEIDSLHPGLNFLFDLLLQYF